MIFNKNLFAFLSILFFIFPFSYLISQEIVLSEIMFAPDASNSEFIEIRNISDIKQIDLTGFQIKYHTVSPDEIFSVDSNYTLLPKQYAVIFEADYDFVNGLYKNIIPDDALLFVLDDNAFGSTGMSNSTDRTVYLINNQNDTLDIHQYTADNGKGYSDERISFDDSLWLNSTIKNGTPGKKNSVAPINFDIGIISFFSNNLNIILGDSAKLTIVVKNLGLSVIDSLVIGLYKDVNNDNLPQQNELIYFSKFNTLNSNDSIITNRSVIINQNGENKFIAKVETGEDEFLENNISSIIINGVTINEIREDLIINEIMYAPNNPEPEWIEIYNNSDKIINLNKYQISDLKDTTTIFKNDFILTPKEYFVIADDTTITELYPELTNFTTVKIPTLNNSSDNVILLDSLSRVIDSVYYFSDWGGKNGNSLERIDASGNSSEQTNWLESNTPTPGLINSVSQKEYNLSVDTIITNPHFPIINDKVQLSTRIINTGKNEIEFSLELFSDVDLDSLQDNLLESSAIISLIAGDSITYKFNYIFEVKELEQNIIVKLNVNDDDNTDNNLLYQLLPAFPPGSIIVNEIMYSPTNEEPEWIELYNKSEYDIKIKNWSIGDVLTNPVFKQITDSDFILSSKSYLVITKSNSIFNFHRNIFSDVIELKFANLNNDEDGLVLKDSRSITIDSVRYLNEWGGTGGKSLERIESDFTSTTQNNWKSSVDIEGSTPGRINSVSPKKFDLAVGMISAVPNNPVKGDSIKIKTKLYNYGNNNAENFSIDIYYGSQVIDTKLEILTNLSLLSNDSLIIISENRIEIIDTIIVSVKINYQNDEDIVNNYFQKQIVAGFNKNTVLINEVMFKPISGQPEWVEIVNNSDSVISLRNWSIGDLKTKNIITQDDFRISPDDIIIISNFIDTGYFPAETKVIQTNIPSLSNTKDAVVLYDYRDASIDSVYYSFSSFPENTSIERISLNSSSVDFENWTYSLSETGSSPGTDNSILLIPNYSFDEIIINEIMFDPAETNSEFIELYNNSDREINLGGWKIADKKSNSFIISTSPLFLMPKDYFVIAADSSIYNNYSDLLLDSINVLNITSLNLTNAGKLIYLKDVKGNTIDSISYSEKWHNPNIIETKNVSLELINFRIERNNSDNWSSSVSKEGATPGKVNSINIESILTTSKLNISPNPFSPDNDGFEDFTTISYNIKEPIAQIRIRIFDSRGRLIRTLKNNTPSGSNGSVIFNGLDENNNTLKMGIYIVLFEAVGLNNTTVETIKEVVVVARKF